MKHNFIFLSVILALSGCNTTNQQAPATPAHPVAIPVSQPITPTVSTVPIRVEQAPKKTLKPSPKPIWKPTLIQKIRVDAYVDENGNLHEPTYKYVVAQPGGWNLDAIRAKTGYIPPANEVRPTNLPGFNYRGTAVEKQDTHVLQLFDLESGQVMVTGLVNESDEVAAREMAGPGKVALFDSRVGWIIVDQAVMDGVMGVDPKTTITTTQRNSDTKSNGTDLP